MTPRITRDEAEMLGRKIGAAMAKAAPKPVAPSRKEREIQKAILEYLRTVSYVTVWRTNVGAVQTGTRFVRFGFPGLSDIVGWASMCMLMSCDEAVRHCKEPGHLLARFVCIEVKREGHYPTAEQQHFLDMVKAAGGIAIVARNVSDVQRVLQP